MSQLPLDTIPPKNTGDLFTADEFNTINTVVNSNSDDMESRLISTDATTMNNTLSALELLPISIQPYTSIDLPATAITGTIAFDTTEMTLVYFKDGGWYNVNDNEYVIVDRFTFVVDTTKPGSPTDTFSLLGALRSSVVYNFNIEWGDGSSDDVTTYNDPALSHVYSSPGTYTIKISGIFNGLDFELATDNSKKLVELTNWGVFSTSGDGKGTFKGCENLRITATDTPNITNITSLFWFFGNCESTQSIPYMDTSNVVSWFGAFQKCHELIVVPEYDFNGPTDSNGLRVTFQNCTKLLKLPDSLANATGLRGFRNAFQRCELITTIPVIDFSQGSSLDRVFSNCISLSDFPYVPDFSSITIIANGWHSCALTAQSIENILQGLYNSNKNNLSTSFASGTNASKSTWTSTANTLYTELTVNRGWTISFNT
jgi:hypothetical protein